MCTDFYGRDVDGHLVEGPWSAALSDFVGEEGHLVAVDRPGDAVDVNTLKAIVRYRGELATDLSTPVAHLPDNGAVILGMYATVEQPGEIALGDRVELLDETAVQPA